MNEVPLEVTGEGEPVVLMPGFPFGGHAFRQLAPLLATRFQVLVADLASLAVGAAQQMGGVLHAVLALRFDCGYVSSPTTPRHNPNIAEYPDEINVLLWLQLTAQKKPEPR